MELCQEHAMMRDTVREFTQKEIIPIAEKMDKEEYFPEYLFQKWADLGILGVTIPKEYGGIGSDALAQLIIAEELAKGSAGIAVTYVSHANLCVHNLYSHGSNEQRKKYLPPLCKGKNVGALAMTEPGAGSDAVSIQTSAVRDGDAYLLNGTKMFITNAPIANTMIVYAKTDKARPVKGVTAFIVENTFEGYRVSRKLQKMGCRSSPTGEVVLDNCRVPAENVLGEENKGIAVMMSGLDIERVVLAGVSLGLAQAAFADSLRYSQQREQFGQPISQFQLIQAKLADMYTGIEAARHLAYDVAKRTPKEKRLRKESAAAALFAAEMATKVSLEAVQIHGGYGCMLEFPVNRYLRDAKICEIGGGSSEIRRLLIARELLR